MDDFLLESGLPNVLTDRRQEQLKMPGVFDDPTRKLAFFRKAGYGNPMWSGQAVYDLAGDNPDGSVYDSLDPYGELPDQMGYRIRGGVVTSHSLQEPAEYTMNRQSRVGAFHDTSPAAAFFQGFANLRWSGMMAGTRPQIEPRPLTQNMNLPAFGTKEMHKATQYKPFPPMGSIVGAYGTQKAL